jgi:hypothetical protein
MQTPMPDSSLPLSRRSVLKLGLAAGAVLSVSSLGAGLAGCSRREAAAAAGLRCLRDADVELFRAVLRVMLAGSLPADAPLEGHLARIDDAVLRLGGPARREVFKLFDLLHLRPTRWLTTGIAEPWREATAPQVAAFLERWRDSRVGLLNAGYLAFNKLCCTSHYTQPEGWAQLGYPGPLAWAYQSLNS